MPIVEQWLLKAAILLHKMPAPCPIDAFWWASLSITQGCLEGSFLEGLRVVPAFSFLSMLLMEREFTC